MKTLITLLALAATLTEATAQTTINGVTLPANMKAGDKTLVLNGGGIRKKAFFKLYTGGFYIESRTKDPKAIIAADKAMAMRLQITSGMISSDNMSEAIREGFEKSTKGNSAPLKAKIDKFVSTFAKEEIKEGNVFDIIYIPGKGVEAHKNGKLQNTIDGLDFKKALFGIWFGDDPADSDLKAGLLGS
jgi:hypothetical protein